MTIIKEHFWLDVEHALTGLDHLLLLVCLLVIAGNLRRILLMLTGFTLANLLVLLFSAFSNFKLPVFVADITMFALIVVLAWQLIHNNKTTFIWKYPGAVSIGIGVIHGAGAASMLNELYLNKSHWLSAILAFNLGLEVAQVIILVLFCAIVFVILVLQIICCPVGQSYYVMYQRPFAYTAGVLALYLIGKYLLVVLA